MPFTYCQRAQDNKHWIYMGTTSFMTKIGCLAIACPLVSGSVVWDPSFLRKKLAVALNDLYPSMQQNQMRTSKFLARFDSITMKEITESFESRLKPNSYYMGYRQYISSFEPSSLNISHMRRNRLTASSFLGEGGG